MVDTATEVTVCGNGKNVGEIVMKYFYLEIEYLDLFWHLKGLFSSVIFQEPRNIDRQTKWPHQRLHQTFPLAGAHSL